MSISFLQLLRKTAIFILLFMRSIVKFTHEVIKMERAKFLVNLMKSKHMKVADISRITGIPYSTVKSIFEKGIGKTSYINVQKICHALGITTDELENMSLCNQELQIQEPTVMDIEKLIARNGKNMSAEDKLRLIKLLSELDI